MKSNFIQFYNKEVVPVLKAELGYKNAMQVPKIKKVVINAGVGRFIKEPNYIENVEQTFSKITGQKPVRTKAKKSISNFKIREGMDIGVVVTLRGERMYHFLEKLVAITLPRVRDFRGLSESAFDNHGNYTMGLKENAAFPEIRDIEKVHGMEVVINTTAKNKEECRLLLVKLGFPFASK